MHITRTGTVLHCVDLCAADSQVCGLVLWITLRLLPVTWEASIGSLSEPHLLRQHFKILRIHKLSRAFEKPRYATGFLISENAPSADLIFAT